MAGFGFDFRLLFCQISPPPFSPKRRAGPAGGRDKETRSVLVDEKGLPLAIVISGANTHDVKLLEETLDHVVVLRPKTDAQSPQNLCLDAGHAGSGDAVIQRGYTSHIRPRGEEKKVLERKPNFRAHHWIVEVTHSFFNRFRKLLVRYEKKAANYMALLQFACLVFILLHIDFCRF